MPNVTLPPETWVDLYAVSGVTVGTQIDVVNITPNDARVVESATQPTGSDDFIPVLFNGNIARNSTGSAGAWALCVGGGAVDVRETA